MAKGNDGNYLQHSVEVAVGHQLSSLSPTRGLHLSITHGMAPFEPCGTVPNGQCRRRLDEALNAASASSAPLSSESVLIRAYRETKASRELYPNTGELLAGLIGRHKLAGGIAEVVPEKYARLLEVWNGSMVQPVNASWRNAIKNGGALAAPDDLQKPWLMSLDPMTFCPSGLEDDDRIYEGDLPRLTAAISGFAATGQPGAAILFVYSISPDARPSFWAFADKLAVQTKTNTIPCWLHHQGGNRNLAAMLCYGSTITVPAGIQLGR